MEPFRIEAELASTLDQLSAEELYSFAKRRKYPDDDYQIELYIYACFLLYKKFPSATNTFLTWAAFRRARRWIVETSLHHHDHGRRQSIMKTFLTHAIELDKDSLALVRL